MKPKRSLLLATALVFASMLAAVSCADDESASDGQGADGTAAAESGEIVIGLSAEDTGQNAAVQTASGEGVRAAVEQINSTGGIDGQLIKLIERDGAGDPAKTILNVQEMAAEGAVAIIGPQTGGACQAVAPVLTELGIPGVCTTPSDLPEDETNVFGVGVELSQVDAAVFDHLVEENGKVGVLSQKTPLGDLVNAHIETSTPDGATIDVKQIDVSDTSAKSQLQSFVADEAGGVFIAACGPIAVTSAKELVDLGYQGKIMLFNCFASESAAKSIMGFANGNIETLAPRFILGNVEEGDPQFEAIEEFGAAGGEEDIVFASGWDGLMLIATAIERAGSSDPADIISTLEDDFDFAGVWSLNTITTDDHRGASEEGALIPARFTSEGTLEPVSNP